MKINAGAPKSTSTWLSTTSKAPPVQQRWLQNASTSSEPRSPPSFLRPTPKFLNDSSSAKKDVESTDSMLSPPNVTSQSESEESDLNDSDTANRLPTPPKSFDKPVPPFVNSKSRAGATPPTSFLPPPPSAPTIKVPAEAESQSNDHLPPWQKSIGRPRSSSTGRAPGAPLPPPPPPSTNASSSVEAAEDSRMSVANRIRGFSSVSVPPNNRLPSPPPLGW
ncbi:hypothetical protein K7432_018522 [Basidiobolus ranarum]|uniref:Uncharacterized protein n=1 Tax=Basidiobolus ranarum TaxID=34480 RepID=A0ABR2WC40_9FUNG